MLKTNSSMISVVTTMLCFDEQHITNRSQLILQFRFLHGLYMQNMINKTFGALDCAISTKGMVIS